jgi:hypothetical protein
MLSPGVILKQTEDISFLKNPDASGRLRLLGFFATRPVADHL